MIKTQNSKQRLKIVFSIAAAMACGTASRGEEPVTLVRDGRPLCHIVVGPGSPKSARFGAEELRWHIRKMTGAEIPILDGPAPQGAGIPIYVGESPALDADGGGGPSGFQSQEYRVSVAKDRILLAGKDSEDNGPFRYDMDDPARIDGLPDMWSSNGSLYAVYDFLERHCGVRWFNQTESGTFVPDKKDLSVPCGELRRRPAFVYRNALNPGDPKSYDSYNRYIALWKSDAPQFREWDAMAFPGLHAKYKDEKQYKAARGNLTGLYLIRSRCGGERLDCNHSFYGYYDRFWEKNPKNPGLFEGKRPEFFAKGYDSKALPPNLCYTNPELIKQVAKDAADYYDGRKTGRDLGIFWAPTLPNPFPLEPMDNGSFCKCEACTKLLRAREERGRAGMASDYFFHFVNACSKELKKTHPDKGIITLAYMTHARPPTLDLDPGANVQYCFTANRMPYDVAVYESQLATVEEWGAEKKTSGRELGLWLYYTFPVEQARNGGFHCFPGFFARTISKQMKVFRKSGVYGMFHCGYGQEVEAYVTFRMMDDPGLDVEVLLDEYFSLQYGGAAKPMKELYGRIEETYCNPDNYLGKTKVFDILDNGSGGEAPRAVSGLTALGLAVTQDVSDKWKDRVSRFSNVRVCEINADGSDGETLLGEDFRGDFPGQWLSAGHFEQAQDGDRSFIELPWAQKSGFAVGKFRKPVSGNGVRVVWEHLADGWDFYRQWHVILATEPSLESLSGYDVTYRRNGHDAKPYMDILKIADAVPGAAGGTLFKLYGGEPAPTWAITPGKDAPPTSLLTEQAPVKGEWTRFQLDITPEKDGTRLRLYRQNAETASRHSIGHQTAQIAWGMLGTEERMKDFAKLMAEAKKLAATEMEKHRVALFEKSVWEYMATGEAQYRQRAKAALPSLKAKAVAAAHGDPAAVDWTTAGELGGTWYKKGSGQRSEKELSGKICHDGEYLYLELAERCDPSALVTSPGVFPYDDWEIYLARQRALPYRQYAVSPSGKIIGLSQGEVNWRMDVPLEKMSVRASSDTNRPDRWTARLSFPLSEMTDGPLRKGDKFYMNVLRMSSPSLAKGGNVDSWVSFSAMREPDRMAEIVLE